MLVLTTEGYREAADCQVGQAVVAVAPVTDEHLINFVEEVEFVKRPRREPYEGVRFGKHRERWADDWNRWTKKRDDFSWVRVNGDLLLFADQSVWANDNVTHAKLLKVGDTLYDAEDRPIIVREIAIEAEGPDEWVRFKISGDHSYVGDDATLHNASRFMVGGSFNWSASNTTNWSGTDGGGGGASVPTSSDDVSATSLTNATAYTVTTSGTCTCRDMTWALPGTSGVPLFVGADFVDIYGSLVTAPGMTFAVGQVRMLATTVGKTITTNGVPIGSGVGGAGGVAFSGSGGGWTLQDNFTSLASVSVSSGTLNTNAKTFQTTAFSSTSGTRTLTLDNSTINITGTSGTPFNVTNSSGSLTLTTTDSTINFTGGAANTTLVVLLGQNGAGLTFGTVNFNAPGIWQLQGNATVKNFSYTSSTDKRDRLMLSGGSTSLTIAASGSLTIAGNSTVNRAFVLTNALGTQKSISVPNTSTVTITNADFQDIATAGTFGTWTGTSMGDALGNSGITFDASTTQTYAGGTNNWSTLAAWSSRVPLPQDDVVVNTTTAGTLTADMPRLGRNIDFTGFTRTLTPTSIMHTLFGNIAINSAMTMGNNGAYTLQGRGSHTITSGGKSWPTGTNLYISFSTSIYTMLDAFSIDGNFNLDNGTFDASAYNVTFTANGAFVTGGAGNTGRTLKMGSGTWEFQATSGGSFWQVFSASGFTLNAQTSTIKFSGAVSTSLTFAGNGKTYNNLWWSNAAATGTLIITGANTFNDFKINRTTARGLRFPASTTNVIASWTDESLGTAILTVDSSTAGVAATLSKPGGDVRTDYLSIRDSTATGGANWRAGPNSTSVSNNSGWIFGNVDYANSATLTGAAAVAATAAKNAKPSAALVCATIQAGSIRYDKTAAGALSAGGAVSGAASHSAVASGSLSVSGDIFQFWKAYFGDAALDVGASLGGSQVSSYSKEGSLDAGAEIAGRSIFQAESMTVEVLPSSVTVDSEASAVTVEVAPSAATTTARYR